MRQPAAIDLSQLPPPSLIEALDAESYIASAIADFKTRWPDFTYVLESEPTIKLIEVFAYRELLLRNRVNFAARATMISFAAGSDLDHIGARFGVARMVDGDTVEDDERFRRRIQLAPEAFSVAGPAGAYEFHALSVDLSIADAYAFSPAEGRVYVMLCGNNGALLDDELLDRVRAHFRREDVVPLTDIVSVLPAERVLYDVTLTLRVRSGPDPLLVEAEARGRIQQYARERTKIASEVFRAGIIAAAGAAGTVENVVIASPAQDIITGQTQVAVLNTLTIETVQP